MPTYDFKNTNTNEEIQIYMSISELDTFKKENPHMVQLLKTATPLADPTRVGVTSKPDQGFRDVLKEIKSKHWKSNINTF